MYVSLYKMSNWARSDTPGVLSSVLCVMCSQTGVYEI